MGRVFAKRNPHVDLNELMRASERQPWGGPDRSAGRPPPAAAHKKRAQPV